MALFVLGNALSAIAPSLPLLALARFVSGLPQGAYFGAGAMVASHIVGPGQSGRAFAQVMGGLTIATIIGSPLATLLGQAIGWRRTYAVVACVALLALLALRAWVPVSQSLRGRPLMQELGALRRPAVWETMLVAALGVASIFAIYTFIGPLVTDQAALDRAWIPFALAVVEAVSRL